MSYMDHFETEGAPPVDYHRLMSLTPHGWQAGLDGMGNMTGYAVDQKAGKTYQFINRSRMVSPMSPFTKTAGWTKLLEIGTSIARSNGQKALIKRSADSKWMLLFITVPPPPPLPELPLLNPNMPKYGRIEPERNRTPGILREVASLVHHPGPNTFVRNAANTRWMERQGVEQDALGTLDQAHSQD